jgi:hypothetical protein
MGVYMSKEQLDKILRELPDHIRNRINRAMGLEPVPKNLKIKILLKLFLLPIIAAAAFLFLTWLASVPVVMVCSVYWIRAVIEANDLF